MMSDDVPGIDSAIDAAGWALAQSYDKDYDHLSGSDQAWWREEAQIAVDAWLEDRRRTAEENVPAGRPPVSAAQAELAVAERRARQLRDTDGGAHVGVGPVLDELDRLRAELLAEKREHLRTIEDAQRIKAEFDRARCPDHGAVHGASSPVARG